MTHNSHPFICANTRLLQGINRASKKGPAPEILEVLEKAIKVLKVLEKDIKGNVQFTQKVSYELLIDFK